MKALVWPGETAKGEMYDTVDIPADLVDQADEWRETAARDRRRASTTR